MKKSVITWISLLLVLVGILQAQTRNEGAILGVVTDQSGAVVTNAKVTVQNLDTGFKQDASSDASGYFEILALPIGPYSVTVSVNGFKTWKLDRLVLEISSRSRVSPVLQVGNIAEEMTVGGIAPQIQTESATVQTVVQKEQINDLPLNGRNIVQLTSLTPGIQYEGQQQYDAERGFTIKGLGAQQYQTQFTLDGFNANSPMNEAGSGMPSVDTIAEFNVQSSNFSAENGRFPLQVLIATKAGSNAFHGTAWEFIRNSATTARNYFSSSPAFQIQNQFGAAVGGPIIKDKTFFFASLEALRNRQQDIFNDYVGPQQQLQQGDFSSISTPIIDPTTGLQFPGNQIPANRIDPASQFLMPYLLLPNQPDGVTYEAVAPAKYDTTTGTARIDDVITSKQHIFGRWVRMEFPEFFHGYSPSIYETNKTVQTSIGVNYDYALTPQVLFSIDAGWQYSNNTFNSPQVGKANLTEQAGIQGFSGPLQQSAGGIPNAQISGYTGFGELWGANGSLWGGIWNGKTSLNITRGKHLIDIGLQYDTRSVLAAHNSFAAQGQFGFTGQYTGDGFADYLLGLVGWGARNFPIAASGQTSAPYTGTFIEDTYKVTPKLTLTLGLRYDRWYAKTFLAGNISTFDPAIGKLVAGVDSYGQVNLNHQPVAQYLGPATASLWESTTTAGVPNGEFYPNGYFSPRIGFAWRPLKTSDFVIRGAYGIFTNSFIGNITASAVGVPFWNFEQDYYSSASQQNWRTAFPATPNTFAAPYIEAPALNVKPAKVNEWNVSVQKALPLNSALTVSYVGNRMFDGIDAEDINSFPANPTGTFAYPYPAYSAILLYTNSGGTWYNGLQAKWERRFTNGLTFTASYAFSKLMTDNYAFCPYNTATSICNSGLKQPQTPEGYLRGRSPDSNTDILAINSIYQLPFGRGKQYMSNASRWSDALFGGWELSGIFSYTSGDPLTFDVPGATLGNTYDTRPNLVGNLHVSNPSASEWFNPAALAAPAYGTYGDSGLGIIDGPNFIDLDAGLLKNFHVTEAKYFQFRFEAFNATNRVNLGDPNISIGEGSTGQIHGTKGPARSLQAALKFIF